MEGGTFIALRGTDARQRALCSFDVWLPISQGTLPCRANCINSSSLRRSAQPQY
jgi:hypothetical protein